MVLSVLSPRFVQSILKVLGGVEVIKRHVYKAVSDLKRNCDKLGRFKVNQYED